MNNPETYVLTHIGFTTFLVLIFTDLNKAQILKMQKRDNPHHEINYIPSVN